MCIVGDVVEKIRPIFVTGAPRSGTTMLASMLSSRDDALALPEMHYIHNLLKDEILFGYNKIKVFNVLKNHFMFIDLNIVNSDKEIEALISASISKTIGNILKKYNEKYFNKHFKYWIEHSPHNHKYFNIFIKHFPEAKFIHIVRDGRAVYNSTKETDWGYKDVITGSYNWQINVEKCLILNNAFPEIFLTIRYEDLTKQPEKTLIMICDFLNISFKKSMLNADGIRKPGFAKYTKALGKKANTKSISKWEKSLKKYEIEHFTVYNFKLLNKLGYITGPYMGREICGVRNILHQLLGKVKTIYFSYQAQKRFHKLLKTK